MEDMSLLVVGTQKGLKKETVKFVIKVMKEKL